MALDTTRSRKERCFLADTWLWLQETTSHYGLSFSRLQRGGQMSRPHADFSSLLSLTNLKETVCPGGLVASVFDGCVSWLGHDWNTLSQLNGNPRKSWPQRPRTLFLTGRQSAESGSLCSPLSLNSSLRKLTWADWHCAVHPELTQ